MYLMKLLAGLALLAAPAFGQSLCTYTITPTNFPIGNQMFNGSISVTPLAGTFCSGWTASVNPGVNWLHITSDSAGNGPGTVEFTADANPAGTERKGTMTVAGTQILVDQSPKICNFAISLTTVNYLVVGGTGTFQVTANCFWQAASTNGDWITVAPNSSGTTNGTVNYTVAANPCVPARKGSIVIQTGLDNPPILSITQDGSAANLTVSPSSLTVDSGASDQRVLVNTGTGCPWTAASDVSWMQVTLGSSGNGNGGVAFHVLANTLATRTGNIKVTPSGVVGAVSLAVTQPVAGPPVPAITSVANAASYSSTAVSPGEIVTIFGNNLGPGSLTLYQLTNGAFPTSIAGTQVLFDNAPAPMIYTSLTQVSAVVPYAVAGKSATNIQVKYQGTPSNTVAAPVQATTPGIFSLDSTGIGPAAVLNQDFSINSISNPAARGSVIAIYCTGGGVTNPASADGSITGSTLPLPALTQNASVSVGGIDAKVLYSGAAPQSIAGLTQINVEIPAGVAPGSAVPFLVQIGTAQSQTTVTIAVK